LHLMRSAKDAFLVKEWLAADADPRGPAEASLAEGVSCDGAGCVTQLPDGAFVSLALQPDALADDCARAALIVTARQPPSNCAAPVITLERLRRRGTLALRRTRDGFAINAVKPNGFDRPWAPALAGEGESEPDILRPAAPRAVDATPSEADLQSED
jgi:competence protein ComEC